MKKLILPVAIVSLLLTNNTYGYEDTRILPIVEQEVSTVIFYPLDQIYRVCFFDKNGFEVGNRPLNPYDDPDFVLVTENDQFVLIWKDYNTCWRFVRFKTLIGSYDPEPNQPDGPWWGMQRNMRDLLVP